MMLPAVSVPTENATRPAATAAAGPAEDPTNITHWAIRNGSMQVLLETWQCSRSVETKCGVVSHVDCMQGPTYPLKVCNLQMRFLGGPVYGHGCKGAEVWGCLMSRILTGCAFGVWMLMSKNVANVLRTGLWFVKQALSNYEQWTILKPGHYVAGTHLPRASLWSTFLDSIATSRGRSIAQLFTFFL